MSKKAAVAASATEGGRKKTAFEAPRANLWLLLPEELTVVTDKLHYLYDPRVETPPDEALLTSIRDQGVIEPVVVVKDGPKTFVVAGRRRVRAVALLNKQRGADAEPIRVPCVLRRGNETDLYVASVAENTIRRNDTILETVEKATRLMQYTGDLKRVAAALGCTDTHARRLLQANELDASVRAALSENKIGLDAALQFKDLPRSEQAAKLKEVLKNVAPLSATTEAPASTASPCPAPSRPRASSTTKKQMPAVSAKDVKRALGKSSPAAAPSAPRASSKMRSYEEVQERLAQPRLPPDYRGALLWLTYQDPTSLKAAAEKAAAKSAASPPAATRSSKSPFVSGGVA